MFLDRFLTEYDDSLTGEPYIDPMGTLVIWSSYGRQIFRNRVNSISNDVRNYTLNLFNHTLVRRIIDDESVQLKGKLLNEYGSKDSLHFKYACLLYLENLFVYSILRHEVEKGVESIGVLGSSNARRRWVENKRDPEIVFTHGKAGQILVRQLGLGVSGRYKTPMMEIGFFDKHYHYHQPASAELWQEAEQFIASQPRLRKLADALLEHLRELLGKNSKQPSIWFSEIPKSVTNGYASALASSTAVGQYARNFWLKTTGLDDGAAGTLLQVLDENAASKDPLKLDDQTLMEMAVNKDLLADEKIKMVQIMALEPFLSDVMLMFTLLAAKKSRPQEEVEAQWRQFERDELTLPQRARQLLDDAALIGVVTGTARKRMQKLLTLAGAVTLDEQIKLLLDYHGMVMQGRGQAPWLLIDSAGLVKVHVRPWGMPEAEDWLPGAWFHSYYLPQFKSLVRGLQGESQGEKI